MFVVQQIVRHKSSINERRGCMVEPTNVTIDGYPFVCVPLSQADFNDVAAIYVIICVAPGGSWTVVDVGQTGELGTRIDAHKRKECWKEKCPNGNLWVCVHRMPSDKYSKEDRLKREKEIRAIHPNICGER